MPEPLSQARCLFEKFTAPTASALLMSLPSRTEKTFESDWLDFKRGSTKDKDIHRIWSKALGAMSNNEGGVLVWGLISEKDPATKIDAVQSVDLVPDVFALRTRLMELRHQATDPPIGGVEIVELPVDGKGPEGFVVCYIPESRAKPHRSEQADLRNFYLRMGDSAVPCSVSILRQLFYPQVNHRLRVSLTRTSLPVRLKRYQIKPFDSDSSKTDVKAAISLEFENTGKNTTEHIRASIAYDGGEVFSYFFLKNEAEPQVDCLDDNAFSARLLHPGMKKRYRLLFLSKEQSWSTTLRLSIFAKNLALPMSAAIPLDHNTPVDGTPISVDCT